MVRFRARWIWALGLAPYIPGALINNGWAIEGTRVDRRATIEEVIVTAKRREERAQDLGMSLSVLSGDRLQNLGIVDTSDLAKQVPGFSYSQERLGTPIFTLRGVGFNDASAAAQSPVGVYIDEVNLPYSVMSKGANIDIQRVEILKGPQGTLYGRSTTAGAINYISNTPTQEFEVGITATYARFDKADVATFVSGGLDSIQGRLAFRQIRSREGWQTNQIFPDERFGEDDKWFGRALLNWDPAERWNIVLGYSQWEDNGDGQMPQNHERFRQSNVPGTMSSQASQNHPTINKEDSRLTAWHPSRSYGAVQERGKFYGLEQTFRNGWAKIAWQLFDTTELKLTIARQLFTDDSVFNQDGLAVEQSEAITDVDSDATSIELKLTGLWAGPAINWTAGYYRYKDTVDEFFLNGISDSSASNGGTLYEEGAVEADQEQDSNAVFAQADWEAFSTLNFTLGARYTEYSRDFTGCSRGDQGLANLFTLLQLQASGDTNGPEPGDCITLNDEGKSDLITQSLEEDNISGRFVVEWTPLENFLTYGSAARGFKSGGFPSFPAARGDQYQPVTQEKITAYEIGIKSQWLANSLRINAAAFYYDYRDKQLQSFFNDPFFGLLLKLQNIDRVKNTGMELETNYTPLPGLVLSLSTIYLDARIEEFSGLNSEGQPADFSGNKVNDAPQWEAIARIDYELPLSSVVNWTVTDNLALNFGVNASYADKSFGFIDNDPNYVTESHTIVDASAGLESLDGRWSLVFWGRNITNEFYTQGFGKVADVGFRFTGMPQTYGMTFSYEYGR